jgi:hypothetical protein
MSVFKVNGIPLPPPVSAVWSFADLSSEESGRSTRSGAMQKDIISQKRTLTFTWGILTRTEASTVAQLCKNSGAAVYLTYPDILTAKQVTGRFYTGDLTEGSYIIPNSDDIRINGMSCSFIEM